MADKPRPIDRFMTAYHDAVQISPSDTGAAVADAAKALRRIIAKAEARSAGDEYEQQRVIQNRGPLIAFSGKLLARFGDRPEDRARWSEGELWETPKGNWVAVFIGNSDVPGERDIVTATVIEAGDVNQMRLKSMDAFNWHPFAISGIAKALGWSLIEYVE